ncbi:MAG TPA: hypothetical protein VFA21_16910 [Pyrinomonadaceae bacterium]|nr:hypothetical protein [Pyrinomonadaceae bacterium]
MKRFFFAPAIMLTLAGLLSTAFAQTRATGRAPQTSVGTRVAVPLPASDAVLTADLKRILTEAAPQALASDSQRLAQLNADVDEFKRRMGVDAREFDTLAVGAHLTRLPSGAAKVADVVAVARGTFDSNALIARTRAAAGTRLSEQTYGGKTLYVVAVNDSVKLFGLLKTHVSDLAICVLDQYTLLVGEPAAVRAAVDVAAGRGARVDPVLLNQAQTNGNLVAFAGNVPPGTFAGMDTGLPNVDRALANIRGFYGTINSTSAGVQMATTLRAANDADAKQLYQTLDALRQVAPGLISMAGAKARFAQSAINNLKIATRASEVQLSLSVPQSDIASLLRAL